MGLLKNLLRQAFDDGDSPKQTQSAAPVFAVDKEGRVRDGDNLARDSMPNKFLTLERAYAAIAADLATIRLDQRVFADQMRELEQRSEQVFGWLAQLGEDIRKAIEIGPPALKNMDARDRARAVMLKRAAQAVRVGVVPEERQSVLSPMMEGLEIESPGNGASGGDLPEGV